MSDRYLSLVNSPVGSAVASRVGLPRPAVLRRYEPGAPLLPGPAVVGSTTPGDTAGLTSLLAELLSGAGIDVLDAVPDVGSVAALVLDARSVREPGDLASVRDFLSPGVKRLGAGG